MKVVSDVDLYVSTSWGAAARLKAGVPVEYGEKLALRCIEEGARVVEEKPQPAEPLQDEVTALSTVLENMMDAGNPADFKADGYPKISAVKAALGRSCTSDEVSEAWEAILNS